MSSGQKVTYVTLLADESIHPKFERSVEEVTKEFGKHHAMYIGGEEVRSKDGEFEDRSPMDTTINLGYFQQGNADHVRQAIESASRAFAEWSQTPWEERVRILRKAADIIDRNKFSLAALITYEVGKNRFEAIAEVSEAVDMIDYYCDQMEANKGFVKETGPGAPGERSSSAMKPYGTWCVISPFNFPIALAASMATGALITGNTVVFKPTSDAPFAGEKLYRAYIEAGVPEGAINMVTGPGERMGAEICGNSLVAGIAFTGSRDVGMKLYLEFLANQPYPKPFIAEMGSKNPTVVTANADLEKAVEGVVRAAFGYGGQKCSATSRVYVQKKLARAFVGKLVERASQLKVGDPRAREVFVGPVVNERAYRKYQRSVELAQKDGGKILLGGKTITEGELAHGYYVPPTVIAELPKDHALFREELFVPIVAVAEFSKLSDAIAEVNRTEYGLTAGIFSEDPREVETFFTQCQFGVIYANRKGGATTGAWPGAQSFGGWKASGATGKGVGGPYYLLQFMREQSQTMVK